MYDIAVIGSGPAGISAVINLKILGKNFIWFSSRKVSKKVSQAQLVKNYPKYRARVWKKVFLNTANVWG